MRVVVIALAALAISGCGVGEPQYEGVVASAVRSSIEISYGGDACGRTAFEPTDGVVVRRGDEEIAWDDVREGSHVRVWTNGYQDDSCPSLAGAERIEVTKN